MIWTHFAMLAVGLLGGLYWGERGRRLAAERRELTGYASTASTATVESGPPSAEERLRNAEDLYRTEPEQREPDKTAMADAGAEQLYAMARDAGRPITHAEARQQAEEAILQAM